MDWNRKSRIGAFGETAIVTPTHFSGHFLFLHSSVLWHCFLFSSHQKLPFLAAQGCKRLRRFEMGRIKKVLCAISSWELKVKSGNRNFRKFARISVSTLWGLSWTYISKAKYNWNDCWQMQLVLMWLLFLALSPLRYVCIDFFSQASGNRNVRRGNAIDGCACVCRCLLRFLKKSKKATSAETEPFCWLYRLLFATFCSRVRNEARGFLLRSQFYQNKKCNSFSHRCSW